MMCKALIKLHNPTPMLPDNQSATSWVAGERWPSSCARHIEVRVHFSRELVEASVLNVLYVPSEEHYADILTKYPSPTVLNWINKRLEHGGAIEEEC